MDWVIVTAPSICLCIPYLPSLLRLPPMEVFSSYRMHVLCTGVSVSLSDFHSCGLYDFLRRVVGHPAVDKWTPA